MVAEFQSAVTQPRRFDVIDIAMLAQDQVLSMIFRKPRPNPAITLRQGQLFLITDSLSRSHNCIYNFLVAGTATKVRGQGLFNLRPGRLGIVADQNVGLHDDARDTEATLDTSLGDKGIG